MVGKVKWFNDKKGYGFITIDEEEEVFVHYSSIEMKGYRSLYDDQEVECDVIDGEKGRAAVNVKPIEK